MFCGVFGIKVIFTVCAEWGLEDKKALRRHWTINDVVFCRMVFSIFVMTPSSLATNVIERWGRMIVCEHHYLNNSYLSSCLFVLLYPPSSSYSKLLFLLLLLLQAPLPPPSSSSSSQLISFLFFGLFSFMTSAQIVLFSGGILLQDEAFVQYNNFYIAWNLVFVKIEWSLNFL